MGIALVVLAILPMVASLANGFAWDDAFVIESNPLVQEGQVLEATKHPYWPAAFTFAGSGLWRPTTSAAFAVEWPLFGGSPRGFHAVSLLLHAAVTLLIFVGLTSLVGVGPAFLGGAVFAVHPVHVEAVANSVGQAELLAALFAMIALLAWQAWLTAQRVWVRVGLLLVVGVSYALALGAKEIAVTLPGLALLVGAFRGQPLRRAWPLVTVSASVLLSYLALRIHVVGTLAGEVPAPELVGLATSDRIFTGLSVWVDYLRLLVFPLELSADYGPAVRFPARGLDPFVLVGATVLLASCAVAVVLRKRRPWVSLGIAWIVLSILPVSHLVIPAGVLVAERTLYLPSIGLALIVGGLAAGRRGVQGRRWGIAGAVVVILLGIRSAVRVPVWRSSETVLASIEARHPRSHLVLRRQAAVAMQSGRAGEARGLFEEALALVPNHFSLLTESAQFESVVGDRARAEALAARAIDIYPTSPHGYVVQARVRVRFDDLEGARAALIEGVRRAEPAVLVWEELEALSSR